jgi:hypothetical protein
MLVCNVSLRPPRSAIAADVAEITAAVDALATSNVVFATLVDDPASVGDLIDAYLGVIMLEATNADTVLDASIPSGLPLATLDGIATNVTMSNGNRTATHSTTTEAGVRSTAYKTIGKYYFEVTVGASNGTTDGCGILMSTGTYSGINSGQDCTYVYPNLSGGAIYTHDGSAGISIGAVADGSIVGIAIDLDLRLGWFRQNGGNWNGNVIGSQNPATATGGVNIEGKFSLPTIGPPFSPCVSFSSGSPAGDNMTANFGQSTYSMTPPSGFGNWTT